ncbi:MAG TPA: TIM barrel protein [Symbiobacteriaceae bacterium]|nr:TIM barrel protein [Symbiobacteriaceae bacterium]
MAQLFVPLSGGFQKIAGSGFNAYGENLDRPQWQGCEIGFCNTFPDVLGAVSEAEFHDWIIGVHHPLFLEKGPPWCSFLDPDPAARQHALDVAATSAVAAHHLGARYILFHFPWPYLQVPGMDYRQLGWYFTQPEAARLEDWPEAKLYDVSRRVFEHLAGVQAKEQIRVVFEIDGPNPYYFDGEMYTRLFEEFPDLSLCVDTGRLGLLARTHGQDPLALVRRWLPWTRHLHLHTSLVEGDKYVSHVPTDGSHTIDRWPAVTPAADIARMVVAAQPRCTVVLEHNPQAVPPDQLERCHAWASALVKGEG